MPGVHLTVIITGLPVVRSNPGQVRRSSAVGHVSCSLQRLVRRDKSQALHRIRLLRFAWGHVEEGRIEETGLVDKASIGRVAGVDALSRGVVMRVDVKSISGNLAMNIQTLLQEFP